MNLNFLSKIKEIAELKRTQKLITISLFIFCVVINVYPRLFPAYFPQFKEKAKITVKERILDEINKKVKEFYPDYNPYAKTRIVKELFDQQLKDKAVFNQAVKDEYKKLKDKYQDDQGQTRLLELDPYHWMRYTENVLKYGHPGDKKEGKNLYDTYMFAPVGGQVTVEQFLFYSSAYLYKAFVFFFRNISLQTFLFYLPVFYSLIFLSLIYFFSKNIFSTIAALVTTLFTGLNAVFIQRSCAGWFDSDILSLIMPLLIVWFILQSLKAENNVKKIIFFSSLAAFFQGLYPVIWMGWWFIFLVIIGFFFCSILNNYLIHQKSFSGGNKENFRYLISAGVFIGASIIFCFLIARMNPIHRIIIYVNDNLRLGKSLSASIWPNTYYTVGELMSTNMEKIADYLYGRIIFTLSLIGMFWVYVQERRNKKKDFFYIMFFWFTFMLFASLKSIRFSMFLSLPLAFFLGGFISDVGVKILNKSLKIKTKAAVLVIFITLCALIIRFFLISGFTAVEYSYPLMNDDWQKVLSYIKENTPSQSILNSWWDYGDLFKTVGNRRVIFDGQSQNTPLAYWMGRVLLSKDEKEALKILRMLNNASNETFSVLNKYIPDSFECIEFLEKLFSLEEEKINKLLTEKGFSAEDRDKIIGDLTKKPAPAYFLVESSMLNKMHSISFLGNWNFRKLYVYRNLDKSKEEVINNLSRIFTLPPDEARKIYEEIIITPLGGPIYESISKRYTVYSPFIEGESKAGLAYFDNGLIYNLDSKQALVFSLLNRKYKRAKSILISEEKEEQKLQDKEADFDKGIVLYKIGDKYKSIILDEPLEESLFSRLYLLGGRGLEFFEPFFQDSESDIYVYKIKW